MISVLLVTTWKTACGIAEHSAMLKEAIDREEDIRLDPHSDLDPASLDRSCAGVPYTIVHLNYQASLHSRWSPDVIRALRARKFKVLVTYHDTGVPNSDQCKGVIDAADAAVVHEPFDDLPGNKTYYWRMGVPNGPSGFAYHDERRYGMWKLAYPAQPVLGSIGFPFGWKNYDKLAEVTGDAGWALMLIAPNATDAQIAGWRQINPYTTVFRDFVERDAAITYLADCDATAFCYVCHNTGQSGAVLQGIATRKPVIALRTCRQFRALAEDPLGSHAILWSDTFEDVRDYLQNLYIGRIDPLIVALAHQDGWPALGKRYAQLYRSLVP